LSAIRKWLEDLGATVKKPTAAFLMSMCAALAVTTRLQDGVAIGLCITVVLVLSSLTISLLSSRVPEKLREVTVLLLFAVYTTAADMLLSAWLPSQNDALGIFLPLIAASGSLIAWVDRTASRMPLRPAGLQSALTGLRMTAALAGLSLLRELFGSGTVAGFPVFASTAPVRLLSQPAGGFLLFGFLIAAVQGAAAAGRRKKP